MKPQAINATKLLHEAELRATPGRIELIELLASETQPMTVKEVGEKLASLSTK